MNKVFFYQLQLAEGKAFPNTDYKVKPLIDMYLCFWQVAS